MRKGNCGFGVYPLDDQTTVELENMIQRIARSKRGSVRIDLEDLVSELWIKVLEVIEDKKEVDYGLLSQACFYRIVDIVRSNIRKEDTPYSNSEFERFVPDYQKSSKSGDADESIVFGYSSIPRQKDVEENIELEEILDLFDKENENKERKLVESWMKILGIKEIDEDEVKEMPEKAYERYIAVNVLGYASSSSCGYARLRLKVRNKLQENGYKL